MVFPEGFPKLPITVAVCCVVASTSKVFLRGALIITKLQLLDRPLSVICVQFRLYEGPDFFPDWSTAPFIVNLCHLQSHKIHMESFSLHHWSSLEMAVCSAWQCYLSATVNHRQPPAGCCTCAMLALLYVRLRVCLCAHVYVSQVC